MRLYLSSYKLGNSPEKFVEMVKGDRKVAVINNAQDAYDDPEITQQKLQDEIVSLKALGFDAQELDLKTYFGKPQELARHLRSYNAVWVRGGNSFVLRRAMKESGFDVAIKSLLANDQLVYAGYSAALAVLQKDMHGVDIVDDPHELPKGYPKEVVWDGLGILNYHVAVHYQSDHPESDAVNQEVEFLKKQKIPFKTLRDGEVIVIDGDKEEVLK